METELSSIGPWLVYKNTDGYLIAINADGTGRKILSTDDSPDRLVADQGPYESYISPAPTGGLLAFRTAFGEANVKLTIVSLPEGKIFDVFPLLSSENEGDLLPVIFSTPVWSPSGRYLAFVGAMDGPSADVYMYDSEDKTTTQLTDGPSIAGKLHWSPDDKWILHEAISRINIMRPGKRATASVWAAAADGSEVKHLYDFPFQEESGLTGYQNLLGWISNDQFVVSFESPYDFSVNQAIIVDITKGEVLEIPQQGFSSIALDPTSKTFLMNVTSIDPSTGLDLQGQYLGSLEGDELQQIDDDLGYLIWYPELDHFFIEGYHTTKMINPEGEVRGDWPEVGVNLYPSPRHQRFASIDDKGVTIYELNGDVLQHISFDWIHEMYPWDLIWLPDSSGYYFKGSYTIGPGFDFYLVEEIGNEPILLASDFAAGSFPDPYPDLVWVMP
jgi:hypothetical protein